MPNSDTLDSLGASHAAERKFRVVGDTDSEMSWSWAHDPCLLQGSRVELGQGERTETTGDS